MLQTSISSLTKAFKITHSLEEFSFLSFASSKAFFECGNLIASAMIDLETGDKTSRCVLDKEENRRRKDKQVKSFLLVCCKIKLFLLRHVYVKIWECWCPLSV